QVRRGIDWAYTQESRGTYAVNLLIGHHGWFSLTPLWLLLLLPFRGRRRKLRQADPGESSRGIPWFCVPLTLMISVVVIGFYALKSNNYGGFANGPRWLMWLTPLWLLCLLPCADSLG